MVGVVNLDNNTVPHYQHRHPDSPTPHIKEMLVCLKKPLESCPIGRNGHLRPSEMLDRMSTFSCEPEAFEKSYVVSLRLSSLCPGASPMSAPPATRAAAPSWPPLGPLGRSCPTTSLFNAKSGHCG